MRLLIAAAIIFSANSFGVVSYEDCLQDAETNGNHIHAVAPLPECAGIIEAESGKVENSFGLKRAYGKDKIIYVDTKDPEGNVLERILLAGDQTELSNIQKIFIDNSASRLYVIQSVNQKNQLLIFNLDFLGNVTPLNVITSDSVFNNVSSLKAEGSDKIEVINPEGAFLINSDAESRTSRSVQKALTITPK